MLCWRHLCITPMRNPHCQTDQRMSRSRRNVISANGGLELHARAQAACACKRSMHSKATAWMYTRSFSIT